MKKYKTLKKYKKAQFRHYNRHATLSKMKGGARDSNYIKYRKEQLRRVEESLSSIIHSSGQQQLKSRLERLRHLLEVHIKNLSSSSIIWSDSGERIDREFISLNHSVKRTIAPIESNKQSIPRTYMAFKDDSDENSIRLIRSRGITKGNNRTSASARALSRRSI